MILTRADPPFSLSRLRAQGQLVEIRATNLKFTATETEVFFNDRLKMTLSSDEVSAFEERTEGWITGLQLVSLALQGLDTQEIKKFADAFSGSHFYIVDYLVDEVLNRQPEAIRDFLLHTSILDQMTGALCNQMTGRDDSQVILERLEQENLFLIPLDDERQWYRYHHLFADVLRSRLKNSSPDLLEDLHMYAVEWYQENGFISEAVSHSIQATNTEKVAELIEQNALGLLMRGEFTTLLGWIEHVETLADQHPWICIYAAWAYTLSGKLDVVEPWLSKVEEKKAGNNLSNDDLLGHMAAIRAYASASQGDAHKAIAFAHKALDYLPETNQIIRGVATMTLGTANRIKGNNIEATQALEKAGQLGHQAGNLYLELGAISSLADILFDQGKLHQSYDTYNQMLRLATRPDGSLLHAAGMAYFGLSMIVYEWGDIEDAGKYSQLAIDLCKQWGHIIQLAGSYVMQSRVFLAQGEIEEAQHALNNAENLSRSHSLVPRADSWLKAFRVRLWLAQENVEATAKWAEKYNESNFDVDFSYLREAEYLTLVRVQIVQKEFEDALRIIEKLESAAERTGRMGSLVEILTLKALVYQAMDDIPQALNALERALNSGRPEEYLRVFIDEGPPMIELLRHAGSKGIESHYVATILAATKQEAALPTDERQPLIDPLSNRELEILELLADGCSNQDVAERLIIAVGTVKAHTVNIYRKLNVNSRLQAVARARELNLM
jgi:LuxR family maltose regulon positive regulatory protein